MRAAPGSLRGDSGSLQVTQPSRSRCLLLVGRHHLLDLGDGFTGVQPLWEGLVSASGGAAAPPLPPSSSSKM